MRYRKLGQTDEQVSIISLGTMTWGEQNTEADAHQQLDYAVERGVNLVDAAEMYPVPPQAETQGRTETYLGSWLAKSSNRVRVFVATKVAGPARNPKQPRHLRGGGTRLDRSNIIDAVEASLARLRTDHIDLYQLHWPDRSTNTFGLQEYPWVEDEESVPILDSLIVLADLVQAGKIRYVGVSNETPWGVSQFLHYADTAKLPRIVSIQNPYSLLNRTFEIGLSEFSHREHVGLLAYSPLGFGVLSGKYLNGQQPVNSRLTLFERFTRYSSDQARRATDRYVKLARQWNQTPAQLALAFVLGQRFVTSAIVGSTSLEQLNEALGCIDLDLTGELLNEIQAIHVDQPNPSP